MLFQHACDALATVVRLSRCFCDSHDVSATLVRCSCDALATLLRCSCDALAIFSLTRVILLILSIKTNPTIQIIGNMPIRLYRSLHILNNLCLHNMTLESARGCTQLIGRYLRRIQIKTNEGSSVNILRSPKRI